MSDPPTPTTDPLALSIINDMDTALAVLNIGRDHGITPQADACLRDVTIRSRDYLAAHRPEYGRSWAEVRSTWIKSGPTPAPVAAALAEAVTLIELLVQDDRRAANRVRDHLRSTTSLLPHLRLILAKAQD